MHRPLAQVNSQKWQGLKGGVVEFVLEVVEGAVGVAEKNLAILKE